MKYTDWYSIWESIGKERIAQNMKQDYSNRENILNCARKLFFEKGYDTVGVQEIVDTAGITKPTMYYYFKSKHGLLENMLEEGICDMLEQLRKVTAQEGEYANLLEQLVNCYFDVALEKQELFLLLISLFSSAKDNEAFCIAKPYIVEYLSIIKEFFEKHAQTHKILQGREDELATALTGMINMYMMISFEREKLGDRKLHASYKELICKMFSIKNISIG